MISEEGRITGERGFTLMFDRTRGQEVGVWVQGEINGHWVAGRISDWQGAIQSQSSIPFGDMEFSFQHDGEGATLIRLKREGESIWADTFDLNDLASGIAFVQGT